MAFLHLEVPNTLAAVVLLSWGENGNLEARFNEVEEDDNPIPVPREQMSRALHGLADAVMAEEPGREPS
jgi:hypothetical protein